MPEHKREDTLPKSNVSNALALVIFLWFPMLFCGNKYCGKTILLGTQRKNGSLVTKIYYLPTLVMCVQFKLTIKEIDLEIYPGNIYGTSTTKDLRWQTEIRKK